MAEPIAEVGYLAGACGHTGTAWQKLQMLWGYYDRWQEDLSLVMPSAGNYAALSTAVPEGYVYVLEIAAVRNATRAAGPASVQMMVGDTGIPMLWKASVVQWEPLLFAGRATMKEGDQIQLVMNVCQQDDEIQAFVHGHKMRLDL